MPRQQLERATPGRPVELSSRSPPSVNSVWQHRTVRDELRDRLVIPAGLEPELGEALQGLAHLLSRVLLARRALSVGELEHFRGRAVIGFDEMADALLARDFVIPGDPASTLMSLLEGDERRRMPPDAPLPRADIHLIRAWIEDGAPEARASEWRRRLSLGTTSLGAWAEEAAPVGTVDPSRLAVLGEIEALTEEVDPDEGVELSHAEVPQDVDPLDGVDVGVEVADPHAHPEQEVGEVLGHPLGERRHQDALLPLRALADLGQQVVHLPLHRAHLDDRVEQAGRADDLLDHHPARLGELVRPRCRRDKNHLPHASRPLLETQGSIVEGRGQPEAVRHEHLLAEAIDLVHTTIFDADVIGRLGGDEFCVVLPGVGHDEHAIAPCGCLERPGGGVPVTLIAATAS